jgi:virulence-associated protein VagC
MAARDLLADLAGAGLSVIADGDRLVIRPASKLTDGMRAALRNSKREVLALLATEQQPDSLGEPQETFGTPSCTDADSALFRERRARMLRWGWAESDVDALAGRLANRDHNDDRVSCIDCRHFRPGRCGNHRRAGLPVVEVGRDLASMPQRCPGFASGAGHDVAPW